MLDLGKFSRELNELEQKNTNGKHDEAIKAAKRSVENAQSEITNDKVMDLMLNEYKRVLGLCNPQLPGENSLFQDLAEGSYHDFRLVMLAGAKINSYLIQCKAVFLAFRKVKGESKPYIEQRMKDAFADIKGYFEKDWSQTLKNCLKQPSAKVVEAYLKDMVYPVTNDAKGIVTKLKEKYPQSEWLTIVYPAEHTGPFKQSFRNEFLWTKQTQLEGSGNYQVVIGCKPAGVFTEIKGLMIILLNVHLRKAGAMDYRDTKDHWETFDNFYPISDISYHEPGRVSINDWRLNYITGGLDSIADFLVQKGNHAENQFVWLAQAKQIKTSYSLHCSFPDRMEAYTRHWNTFVVRFQ